MALGRVTFCTLAALMIGGAAFAEPLPATAKKATLDEFKTFADGKMVDVVIFDLGVPVTATLKWDWKKQRITGDALVDGKKDQGENEAFL